MEERILLVEDNKALAKLIAKKMEKSIGTKVDVAHTMEDAKVLISKHNNYFISLLDLNLPDAPDGEIVDYVLSEGILAIVLTGNIDEETNKKFIDKDIVDYVFKSNMDDVNYIFTTIKRLYKNRQHEVMVVDDAMPMRNLAKNILKSQQYKKVYVAAHGEEALNYFENHPDIKLVLTDYNMPVVNGLELTAKLRSIKGKDELGIIAMTSADENEIASNFLKRGANDFITKPFMKDEFVCRVNNIIESIENLQTIEKMANTDFMTGLYNRRYFYEHIKQYMQEANLHNNTYAVGMVDIDLFKRINDTYGHDAGDLVIKKIAKVLKDQTRELDTVARFGGEEFCIVLKDISPEEAVSRFVKIRNTISKAVVHFGGNEIKCTASIGVTFSLNSSNLGTLINQADAALYEAKESGRNRVEIYEEEHL